MRSLVPLVLALLLAGHAAAAELQVSAAASLTNALQEVGASFTRSEHIRVRFNFAGSDTLARQIREGAPADVFVSADDAQMDRLQREGLLVPGSRRAVLSNELVIVVPANGSPVRKVADLQLPAVRRIALADPQRVPAGVYARQYLQHAGIWPAVASRIVPAENVRAALAAVDAGNADAAIVYRTDPLVSKHVRVATSISGPGAPHISYPAAVLSQSQEKRSASAFVNYLTSPAARAVFARYGFVVPR